MQGWLEVLGGGEEVGGAERGLNAAPREVLGLLVAQITRGVVGPSRCVHPVSQRLFQRKT